METDKPVFTKSPSVIQFNWHKSPEGESFFKKFFSSTSHGRRLYGVLERPTAFDGIEEVTYKVLFAGRNGVGKSLTVANLAGLSWKTTHGDTAGIEVTDIYWPVKIWDKVILFKLQCWDAGEGSMKKYNHILESCQDKVDLRIFTFSFHDSSSFVELPSYLSSYSYSDMNHVASIALGTRNSSKTVVSPSDIEAFKQRYCIEVHSLPLTCNTKKVEEQEEFISLLNSICEILWLRDQHYIMNNSVTV